MRFVAAVAGWALLSSASQEVRDSNSNSNSDGDGDNSNSPLAGANICARGSPDEKVKQLPDKLPPSAKVYFAGSDEFEQATTRWSVLEEPTVNAVVVPGTEADVAKTVRLFLLYSFWKCSN